MIWVTAEDVVAIHSRIIQVVSAGSAQPIWVGKKHPI